MKILFIGDIVGRIGRQTVKSLLHKISNEYNVDFIIANGENCAGGCGITEKTAKELFACGIDVITTGNHIWDKREAIQYISREDRILRPLNFPSGTPGIGSSIYTTNNKQKIAVINIIGRVFMNTLNCPFRTAKDEIENIIKSTNIIIVDFHAEITSEKLAFGHYIDGKVSAIIGTHTHIQTADEKILPKGTAYITDVGMTGPLDSIIGVKKEQVIEKFLTQMPQKFDVATGNGILSAVVIEINEQTGMPLSIQRLQLINTNEVWY